MKIHSSAMYLLCLISEIMGIAKAYTKILASQLLRFIFFLLDLIKALFVYMYYPLQIDCVSEKMVT